MPLPSRVAILGTGLIGTSIGLGLRAAGVDDVAGFDPDADAAGVALTRGAVASAAASPGAAVADADLVFLCMPVDRVAAAAAEVAPHVGPETVVTDVGSAKQEAVAAGERHFGGRFVGGHPMAGSERHGAAAGHADLFDDAFWILTPTTETSSDAYRRVSAAVTALGARPVAVPPDTHDALVARLSHVPQLAASALVDVAVAAGDRATLLGLAGPGFRDVTRIAASDPGMWIAILRSNTQAVLEALRRMGGRLHDLESALAQGRWDDVHDFLAGARAARLELFAKPDLDGEPAGLSLLVPDRPGVLAQVTTAAADLGANIEDLRIVHSTEGGRGRLELIVSGAEAARRLGEVLEGLGYHVEPLEVDR